jgi:hypothetical protein
MLAKCINDGGPMGPMTNTHSARRDAIEVLGGSKASNSEEKEGLHGEGLGVW